MSKLERTFSIRSAFEKKAPHLLQGTGRALEYSVIRMQEEARSSYLKTQGAPPSKIRWGVGSVRFCWIVYIKIRPASGGKEELLVS